MGTQAITAQDNLDAPAQTLIALLFAAGARLSAGDVSRIAQSSDAFSVVFEGAPNEGWAEALVTGLSFDVAGLTPAEPMPVPDVANRVGIEAAALEGLEAIAIRPGPHLAGGENMLPVVRAALTLAKALAEQGEAQAVVWLPARTAMRPSLFAAMVEEWLSGGAFPAIGLTALIADAEGGVTSEGLGFFIGQEIAVVPASGVSAADTAKLAARLVHELIDRGPLSSPTQFSGISGGPVLAEPSADGRTLVVRRQS